MAFGSLREFGSLWMDAGHVYHHLALLDAAPERLGPFWAEVYLQSGASLMRDEAGRATIVNAGTPGNHLQWNNPEAANPAVVVGADTFF